MAFSDCETSSDPCVINANALLKSSMSGIVMPTNGWQVEIIDLPLQTSLEEIKAMFTKYGTLDKVGMIYKVNNDCLNCYLSFDKEMDSIEAMKENGKKVGFNFITVQKYSDSEAMKGNKRLRTEDKPSSDSNGWGGSAPTSAAVDGWGSGGGAPTSAANNSSGGWGSGDTQASDSWGFGGGSDSGFGGGGDSGSGRGRGRGGGRGGGAGGGGGGRGCFNCGDDGHMSRECPKPKKVVTCFKCGEEGHMSRECPKGGGRACFNCGEEGHMSRECSKPRAERGRGRGRGGGNSGGDSFGGGSSATSWGNESESKPSSDSAWD